MVLVCPYCREIFDPDHYNQKFCNLEHRRLSYRDKKKIDYINGKYQYAKEVRHNFPMARCECGRLYQLDFYPEKRKVFDIKCERCKKLSTP